MAKVVIGKTISLRPTTEETNNLRSYMKKQNFKKPSEALKQILKDELPKLEKDKLEPQLEQKPRSESLPLLRQIEDATGLLLACPLRSIPVPYENPIVHWKAPVDTSVCKTCSKYPCESWQDYESWKKFNPDLRPQPTTTRAK